MGEVQQPTPVNLLIATLLNYAFFGGLLFLFAGEAIFDWLRFPAGARWVRTAKENQMAVIMVLFACNMISSQLLSTGAFEVYVNGDLLHSKLQSGYIPPLDQLVKMIVDRAIEAPNIR